MNPRIGVTTGIVVFSFYEKRENPLVLSGRVENTIYPTRMYLVTIRNLRRQTFKTTFELLPTLSVPRIYHFYLTLFLLTC